MNKIIAIRQFDCKNAYVTIVYLAIEYQMSLQEYTVDCFYILSDRLRLKEQNFEIIVKSSCSN